MESPDGASAKIRSMLVSVATGQSIFVTIVFAGVTFGVFEAIVLGAGFHQPWPLNTFLHRPGERFTDYSAVVEPMRGHDPYGTGTSNYLPFSYAITLPLTVLSNRVGLALVVVVVMMCLVRMAVWPLLKENVVQGSQVVVAFLLSYPVLFAIDRGNFVLLVFMFLLGAVYLARDGRDVRAGLLLSCAIAMKGYPVIFVSLFWRRGRYRYAVMAILLAVVETLVSLALLRGGLSHHVTGLTRGLRFYQSTYVEGNGGVPFCTSLYCGLKATIISSAGTTAAATFGAQFAGALTAASALLIAGAAVLASRVQEYWRQVALLCLAIVVFPTVSADYNLILLLIPVALVMGEKRLDARAVAFLCLAALLCIPKNIFHLPGVGGDAGVNAGVFLNPLLLLCAIGVLLAPQASTGSPDRVG